MFSFVEIEGTNTSSINNEHYCSFSNLVKN